MSTTYLSRINRFQATGLHLLASLAVLIFIFGFVKLVWYPQQLFFAANGFDILKILVAVDLVLGPLVMLIIFNPKKKSLKFDVIAILICQLLFLGYGVWSLYTVRPAYIAFVEKEFTLVKANEIEVDDLNKVEDPSFKHVPFLGPIFIGTKIPESKEKRDELMFASLENRGIQTFPQYYVPLKNVQTQMLANCQSIEQLTLDKSRKEALEKVKIDIESRGKKVLFCSLFIKEEQLFVALDAKQGEVLGIY